MSNRMREIYLDKVVLNMGIGPSDEKLQNAKALLKKLTGHEAAYTRARRRRPEFGIRQGQVIGAVVTLRGGDARDFLRRAFDANNNVLNPDGVANNSVNFGIKEYIYFSGVKYDPKIGMLGLNVNAFFARRGMRVENRKIKRSSAPARQKAIGAEELRSYLADNYGVKFAESER